MKRSPLLPGSQTPGSQTANPVPMTEPSAADLPALPARALPDGAPAFDVRRRLVDLPRGPKRLILVSSDFALLTIALWLALSLRLSML